jgi:hypothetical protein
MSIITCIVMHDDNNNHQCCRMLNQGFIVREEEVSLCKKRKEKKRSHYLKKKRRRGLRQEPSLWSSSYVWFYTYATNLVSQSFGVHSMGIWTSTVPLSVTQMDLNFLRSSLSCLIHYFIWLRLNIVFNFIYASVSFCHLINCVF